MFDNKVAIVTGGGSGIGAAISQDLAAHGAAVVVADIDLAAAQQVAAGVAQAGGKATAIAQDAALPEDNERVVDFAVETYGALHLAVNNAGIAGKPAPGGEIDIADWQRVIDINLNGVMYGMRYQIPKMLEAGTPDCAIVNMTSVHGMVAAPGNGAYTTAKHGVVGMTRNVAAEYGQQGLRVNAVGPGYIVTPLLENNLSAEMLDGLKAMHPLGRLGTAEEVAYLTRFLLSPEASFITGGYYLVDGGYTIV